MSISDENKYLLNNSMGAVAKRVGLGDLVDVATGDGPALVQDHILVGSAGGAATDVAMSGDATIVASGALTIANNAVTTVKILNANVTKAKLAAGVSGSHMVVFGAANVASTADGGGVNVIAVVGAVATDIVHVTLRVAGGTPRTIVTAVPAVDTVTVTYSGDPSTDHRIDYTVSRATS
jgi:hypothetical protein